MIFYLAMLLTALSNTLISSFVPLLVWYFGIQPWKPLDRVAYALKFSSWMLVVYFFQVSLPAYRLLIGWDSPMVRAFNVEIIALSTLLTLGALPVLFLLAYQRGAQTWRYDRFSPQQ